MELSEAQQELIRYMTMVAEFRRKMLDDHSSLKYTYAGMEDFLLHHGVWYNTVAPWTGEYAHMPIKRCFNNAILTSVQYNFRYIEGVACAKKLEGLAIHHAWNLDPAGRVVDTTWRDNGACYFGVEFPTERAIRLALDGATILDPYPGDPSSYDLYLQPWAGLS